MDYYSLHGPNDASLAAITTPDDLSHEYLGSLRSELDWSPRVLQAGPGTLVDHPPNDLVGWGLLCSARMRDVLDRYSTSFIWLGVTVLHRGGEHPYFVLHPVASPDLLDEGLSIRNRATGDVIKPVLSRQKVGESHLFMPYPGALIPICSEVVRGELEAAGISGLVFTPRPAR